MSHLPMQGVRVLEVAQFTFAPAAGAVLADWGADVIKVEHVAGGDGQRNLRLGVTTARVGSFAPIMEHPNRGKRSIGLALEKPEAREVLGKLAGYCDVFITNFLPAARRRLHIDVADLRAANPKIIYVRASAFGARGPEAEKGGYDSSAFWSRGGSAYHATPAALAEQGALLGMPAGAYGDTMGGTTIAGGIAGALFKRERTGEPSLIDVSLLGMGAWALALSVDLSLLTGEPMPVGNTTGSLTGGNPTVGNFRTSDGRFINLTILQPAAYWKDLCEHLGRPELAGDERFGTPERMTQNSQLAGTVVREAIASRTFAEWLERLQTLDGQWAPIQNSLEVARDPQLRANGHIVPVRDAEGNQRELVANPVQFDETPPTLRRAPLFAEHTGELLRELGYDDSAIRAFNESGAVR